MKHLWIPVVLGVAALVPLVAKGRPDPQVVMATPGTGGAHGGGISRYTMRFSDPMVPLGDPRATAPASMTCAVASTGRWVDTQTFVYDFEAPLPGGITCKIDLRDGLKTAAGQSLGGTTSFSIDTGGPRVRSTLPNESSWDYEYGDTIEEDQVFLISTNTPATNASIAKNAYCTVEGIGETIPLEVLADDVAGKLLADLGDDDWSSRNFLEQSGLPRAVSANAAERAKTMTSIKAVKCQRPLPPGKNVRLFWGKGISSPDGRLATENQSFDFTVRKAFEVKWTCSRVNAQAGCNPLEDARLEFTGPALKKQLAEARLTFPDGTVIEPSFADDDKNNAAVAKVYFRAPMPAATKASVSLPADITDESGRKLVNGQRFPLEVAIAEAPPLVKFAAQFGIVESKADAMLPVTVRNVEPTLVQSIKGVTGDVLRVDGADSEIREWMRRVERQESSYDANDENKEPGDRSILAGQGENLKLALPGKGRDFEVVGIPLKKPGFYVVELASPALGKSLLKSGKTRYVSSAALVTNMAVHFKWGREDSLAWVTNLDDAKPIAGAEVRVTDNCTQKTIARGKTDAQGRLTLSKLPDSERGCSVQDRDSSLMVSARSGDDFSFTLTSWGDGISPYDFDLSFGYSAQDDILHTVFDRKLARQGETINMKHILRRPIGAGFKLAEGFSGVLTLTHQGSGTDFTLPVTIDSSGIGENSWAVPQGAPLGDYSMAIQVGARIKPPSETSGPADEAAETVAAAQGAADAAAASKGYSARSDDSGEKTIYLNQTVRVDEYRLPTMKAEITGPKEVQVRPSQVALNLFVGYFSGGAAANLPVSIRTAYSLMDSTPDGWEGWTFGGRKVEEGTVPLDGDSEEPELPLPMSQTLPATLAGDGTARTLIDINQPVEFETSLDVEMDYQDANGETLTASRNITLWPSAIRLGVKTDGWLMRDDDLRLKLVALDPEGKPLRGKLIRVDVYNREILTARRRLIGGFYAYDNQMKTTKLSAGCSTTTDKLGLAQCKLDPGVSGQVTVVASTTDSNGHVARASQTVWLAGEDEWWFGGDNGDRMDVIAEAKSYKAGDTARLQVRMPFRSATALVTVEREGVLSSYVTQLSGKDPVVEVKMPGSYAPNVYVSVMAVRGRVSGFRLWAAQLARAWNLPLINRDGAEPTALVDLAKPSYRIGIANVKVGWESHQLAVKVKADRERYGVRETANVDVAVSAPNGPMPVSTEIAFVAVDQALLRLKANDSWDILSAMMGERPISVTTSTAQTQVVGKRHYGKKAVTSGGDGGGEANQITRENFKPVLVWKGRVQLDASGHAKVAVPLVDSLTGYRLVAVATGGANLFGMGDTNIRVAQDLSLFSGIPPQVRAGDSFGASFTLRNGTDQPMTVEATVKLTPAVATGKPQTITIPAGGSAPVSWTLKAPASISQLKWEVDARSSNGKTDRIAVVQDIIPLYAPEIWATSLFNVGENTSLPVQAPAGALPGLSSVDVQLSSTVAPPLSGVRAYMLGYPYSCFEQQTSRFVSLGDAAGWDKLAANLPVYLDKDGLLRYWPDSRTDGSTELTAYVLSITQEAGLTIPAESKNRMIAAMNAVLDGRLKREWPWGGEAKLLKTQVLAALARNGASNPRMFGQIALSPVDMPTGILAEWITALDRTPGVDPAERKKAEAILRQRIVYEGRRLDITDRDDAPWWLMSTGDEMAIRAFNVVLGRPGWADDEGKMMVGIATRQQRGHWDSTLANAWGTIATKRFAARYPSKPITGVTSLSLGGQLLSQNWPVRVDDRPLRFALPLTKTALLLKHPGGGPWATVSVSAAVPLTKPLFAGYVVKRQIIPVQQAVKGQWSRGDVMRIKITVEASTARSWVVINDPLPPGATVLGGLGGQSQILQSQKVAGDSDEGGSWWDQPSYVEAGKGSWRGYYQWMPRGVYTTEYNVRLNGTGQFNLPATRVEAMYSPEIRGQLPNAPLTVAMR